MKGLAIIFILAGFQSAFAGVERFNLTGKIIAFDEHKVKLEVSDKKSFWVSRDQIDVQNANFKVGQVVHWEPQELITK
jgi:hypothetical protein